jgi:hypothetical protein
MGGVAAAILLTAFVLLIYGSQAAERTAGDGYLPAPLLPGVGARDPRIRVDPNAEGVAAVLGNGWSPN